MPDPSLVEWLGERLDEDQAVAEAATPGPWHVNDESYAESIIDNEGTEVVSGGRWGGEAPVFDGTEDALHIALHDPARVLAEVAAKRRILKLHEHVPPPGYVPGSGVGCQLCSRDPVGGDLQPDGWCETVRLLALPYAGRDGYQDSWRPE